MKRTRTFVIALILCAFRMSAEVIDLNPVADAAIHQLAPNNNMGGEQYVSIGSTAHNTPARALIRFDLSGKIPDGAVVTNVSLTFVLPPLNRLDTTAVNYEVHRLLQEWGEGNKIGQMGSPATAGEATWNSRMQPIAWGAPGGQPGVDFVEAVSAAAPMGPAPNTNTIISTEGLIQDVEAWRANAGTNFGWLLKAADETVLQSAKRFSSRESPNPAVLEISYSLAQTLKITRLEKRDNAIYFEWSGGTPPYQIESITNLSTTNWSPVTTLLDGTNALFATFEPHTCYRVKMVR